ncbi:Rnase Y domain-containing protein, partial [Anaerorhabdus sp.]
MVFNSSSILSGIIGVLLGILIMFALGKLGLNREKQKAKLLVEESSSKAESILRQAALDGKQQVYELKLQAEKELKERKAEIQEMENKLLRREDSMNFRDETLLAKEKQVDDKNQLVAEKLSNLEKMEKELQARIDHQIVVLETVAHMSEQDAKNELMSVVEKRMEQEVAAYIRDKED